MSRAQAHCCRLPSAPLCKSTQVNGTGGRVSAILLRRWVLLSTAQLQGVVSRSFSRACPSLAALFLCVHRRVAVARAVVREAKRQQRRRRSERGRRVGRWCYEEGSHGAQVAFFSRCPRASAPSLTTRAVAAAAAAAARRTPTGLIAYYRVREKQQTTVISVCRCSYAIIPSPDEISLVDNTHMAAGNNTTRRGDTKHRRGRDRARASERRAASGGCRPAGWPGPTSRHLNGH